MESLSQYDVIVIGIGWVGLSTVCYFQKETKNSRAWDEHTIRRNRDFVCRDYKNLKYTSSDRSKNEMMKIGFEISRQVETELANL